MGTPQKSNLTFKLGLAFVALAVFSVAGLLSCLGCDAGARERAVPGKVDAAAARFETEQAQKFVLPEGERNRRVKDAWSRARAYMVAWAMAHPRAKELLRQRDWKDRPALQIVASQAELCAETGLAPVAGQVLAGATDFEHRRVLLLGYDLETILHEAAHWYFNLDKCTDCPKCDEIMRWCFDHPNAIEDGVRGLLNR